MEKCYWGNTVCLIHVAQNSNADPHLLHRLISNAGMISKVKREHNLYPRYLRWMVYLFESLQSAFSMKLNFPLFHFFGVEDVRVSGYCQFYCQWDLMKWLPLESYEYHNPLWFSGFSLFYWDTSGSLFLHLVLLHCVPCYHGFTLPTNRGFVSTLPRSFGSQGSEKVGEM